MSTVYRPQLFRRQNEQDVELMDRLLSEIPNIERIDTIYSQLGELMKIRNPSIKLNQQERDRLIKGHIQSDKGLDHYGVWIYYPWLNKIVHLLDEEEFIEVRTNRNVYKITFE